MEFYPFEVTTVHIIYALLGASIVFFGMFSLFLREKLYVGEAIWAFIFGIIIGPHGANIFNPRVWGHGSNGEDPINLITLEFTRVVLAIGGFAIGVELPKAYMKKHWKSLAFLLAPVMTWGWFVCAGLIYAFIPGLNFLSSLAISACLTPTDPILASAILGGKWADKHVPAHIRHLLAAESGSNDGAAFPFLFLALYLMTDVDVGTAMRDWFLLLWLYKVVLGAVIGCLLGFGFRHLMQFCERRELIDRHSYVAQYISLAVLTMGIASLLGTDDLLAVLACGATFAWDGFFNKHTEESVFSSVIENLFNIAAFVFVGAWMPFEQFHRNALTSFEGPGMGVELWRLIIVAVLVLVFRRLPVMMAMYRWIPDIKTWREALFCGHLGPMGIGAIFISTLANEFLLHYIEKHPTSLSEYRRHQIELTRDLVETVVAFMVLCSIIVHGLSIPGFSLGRRVHSVSTWSRRDTTGGGRAAPDWTNQARLVTRGEDIVINRDVETGEGRGVPFEKTMSMMSTQTLSNGTDDDGHKEDDKLDSATEETKIQADPVSILLPTTTTPHPTTTTAPHIHQQHAREDYRDQFPPYGRRHQTSEWVEGNYRIVERKSGRYGDDLEVYVIHQLPEHGTNADPVHGHSMRDGIWRNFYLGRRRGGNSGNTADTTRVEMGLGDRTRIGKRPTTADTLVADEDTNTHRVSDSSYSQEDVVTSAPAPVPGQVITGDTEDTSTAAVSTDQPAATVSRDPPAPAPQDRRHKRRSRSLTRLPSRGSLYQQPPLDGTRQFLRIITPTGPPETVNLHLDTDDPVRSYNDYQYDVANAGNVDYEIIEVPRGRENRKGMNRDTSPLRVSRRKMSGSSLKLNSGSGMGRTPEGATTPTGTTPPVTPSGSILPPIFTSPAIPHSHSPHSPLTPPRPARSRPRTAPTTPTDTIRTSYPPAFPTSTISRPGTGDSSIRHHRLDSIRASSIHHIQQGYGQGHRTPPRDISPPRSVRFVEGESGNGARMVSVVEIPPTPSIPRLYRDQGGNRKSMVDNPDEEKKENAGSSSYFG